MVNDPGEASRFRSEGFLRYTRNTGWLLGERFLRLTVNLLVGIYVARYLGPERFGSLSYAQSLVGLLGIIALLGLDNIVVLELVRAPGRQRELLGTAFGLKLIAGILMACLIAAIALFSGISPLERWMIIIISLGLIFQSTNVINMYFQSCVQARYIALAQLTQMTMSSATKLIMVWLEAELIWFALVSLLDSIVLALALVWNYRRANAAAEWIPWCFQTTTARELLRRSWPLLFSGLALTIYMKIDQVMIREMLDAKAVGQYAAAVRVSEAWLVIAVILTTSLYPAIIEAKQRDEDLYRRRLGAFYSLMLWLSIGFAAPIAFLADPIIRILFGATYQAAAPVLAVHAWSGIMVFLITASSRWYLAEGNEQAILRRAVLGAVINVALNWYLIPRMGINGAALATLISYTAMAIVYDALDRGGRGSFQLKLAAVVLPFTTLWSKSVKPRKQGP